MFLNILQQQVFSKRRLVFGAIFIIIWCFPDHIEAKGFDSFPKTIEGKISMLDNQRYFSTLVNSIRKARSNINMSLYLFKITKNRSNPANIILDELIKARKRGVTIRVLLEQSDFNRKLNRENRAIAKRLKKNKIGVCFDSLKKQTHTKVIVIDRQMTFLGSHNMSHSALKYNNELSVLIDSKKFSEQVLHYLKSIKSQKCPY